LDQSEPPVISRATEHSPPAPGRQVLFQHLRKTGGTTLVALLGNFMYRSPYRIAEMFEGRAAPPLTGFAARHSPLLLELRTPGSFCFTFLRKALPRLLSERRQWMQASGEAIGLTDRSAAEAILALRYLPMSEILRRVFEFPVAVSSFWNHQSLMLGVLPARMLEPQVFDRFWYNLYQHFPDNASLCAWLEKNRYAILKNALQTLRSLDYVGISEDFDNSARELFERLGLPAPSFIPHVNARAHYADEDEEAFRAIARPFIDLDEELYEEGLELHARQARAARGAPADYLGHRVGRNEAKIYTADLPPGGHGWHEAALRADGKWSRWTGPGQQSYVTFGLDRGRYALELLLFGAVSEHAIRTLALSLDGAALPTTVTSRDDGSWRVAAEIDCAEPGLKALCITVAGAENEHGVEVEALRIASLGARDGEAVVAAAPAS
jgi:hypothetical protein